jgi:hypothetical protein
LVPRLGNDFIASGECHVWKALSLRVQRNRAAQDNEKKRDTDVHAIRL